MHVITVWKRKSTRRTVFRVLFYTKAKEWQWQLMIVFLWIERPINSTLNITKLVPSLRVGSILSWRFGLNEYRPGQCGRNNPLPSRPGRPCPQFAFVAVACICETTTSSWITNGFSWPRSLVGAKLTRYTREGNINMSGTWRNLKFILCHFLARLDRSLVEYSHSIWTSILYEQTWHQDLTL